MSQKDYTQLASSFMDLWQEQLTKNMADQDFIGKMMEAMQQFQPQPMGGVHEQKAPSSGVPFGAGQQQLADLADRMAVCEERLRRMERKLDKLTRDGGHSPKTRQARAKTASKKPQAKSGAKPQTKAKKAVKRAKKTS